jgi:arsenical pump membrane protein
MILSVLFFPKIRLGPLRMGSYWMVALIGALLLLATGQVPLSTVVNAMVSNTAINPIKILILFISMTILSIYLDELGFFRYLANKTLKRAGKNQVKLFFYLYLIVSVLTVFTSNDVIILSFTPFICYFARNAKINAIPYLAAEFVAANTWSMALIIGNPTNIYLGTSYGIGFVEYTRNMWLPTLGAGITAFIMLYLISRKKLNKPIHGEAERVVIKDKLSLWVGIIHLAVCTVLLALSSYIGLEMWLVSAMAVLSLVFWCLVIDLCRRHIPDELVACAMRAPWQLIPFVLSMFVMTIVLSEQGVTAAIGNFLGSQYAALKYGVTSFLTANVVNNIPMSVLFCSIMQSCDPGSLHDAVYATVVGSNIGAFLTPIGALAGIMWSTILNEHGLHFGYLRFLKIGIAVAVPTLFVALLLI